MLPGTDNGAFIRDALKSLAILVSIPFMFVMIFMEIVLFKWLREDGKK